MLRVRPIRKKEYRALLKEFRAEFAKVGCTLTVYKRPICWTAVQNGTHRRWGTTYGVFLEDHKRAIVTFRGKPAKWQILHTIAHELRHAQHSYEGIFKDYNENILVAWRAERNCDTFGLTYLAQRGIIVPEMKARAYKDYDMFKITYGWRAEAIAKHEGKL